MEKQERILDFDFPRQVKFIDFDSGNEDQTTWLGGIAIGDKIICGCCGGLIDIQELWETWDELKDEYPNDTAPIYVYQEWMDISEEIKG